MANVNQTDQTGAAQVGQAPRDADDVSDNFDNGAYSHRNEEYSATMHGENMSRLLYLERQVMLRTWEIMQ